MIYYFVTEQPYASRGSTSTEVWGTISASVCRNKINVTATVEFPEMWKEREEYYKRRRNPISWFDLLPSVSSLISALRVGPVKSESRQLEGSVEGQHPALRPPRAGKGRALRVWSQGLFQSTVLSSCCRSSLVAWGIHPEWHIFRASCF